MKRKLKIQIKLNKIKYLTKIDILQILMKYSNFKMNRFFQKILL